MKDFIRQTHGGLIHQTAGGPKIGENFSMLLQKKIYTETALPI